MTKVRAFLVAAVLVVVVGAAACDPEPCLEMDCAHEVGNGCVPVVCP